MIKYFRTRKIVLVAGLVIFLVTVSSVRAIDSRIADIREGFLANPQPVYPQYVAGITYQDMLQNPSPDELFSYITDNEAFTKDLLDDLKEASKQADKAIKKWIGNEILIAVIDGPSIYTGVFNLDTGVLTATYQDTKTEVWIDLPFLQSLIQYGDTHSVENSIDFAIQHYYEDWGAWVQMGTVDIMLTPTVIGGLTGSILIGGAIWRKVK